MGKNNILNSCVCVCVRVRVRACVSQVRVYMVTKSTVGGWTAMYVSL